MCSHSSIEHAVMNSLLTRKPDFPWLLMTQLFGPCWKAQDFIILPRWPFLVVGNIWHVMRKRLSVKSFFCNALGFVRN